MTIAAKEGKCSRGGGGTLEHLQRDRERDDRTRDETAAAQRWQGARVVVSRGGLAWWSRRKSQREEEIAMTAAQRWQHNGGSGSTGDGGSGSTELVLLEWPELAERRVAGICREKWRSS